MLGHLGGEVGEKVWIFWEKGNKCIERHFTKGGTNELVVIRCLFTKLIVIIVTFFILFGGGVTCDQHNHN